MKKIFIAITTLCFLLMFTFVMAQESSPLTVSQPKDPSDEYILPFPGILPTHPLFFLKKLRDNILLVLISDTVHKVEFRILLSDKYLNMAIFMFDNNPSQALKALEKSTKYLEEAEKGLFEIPAEKTSEIANLKHNFEKSILKHEATVVELMEKHQDSKQSFLETIKTLEDIEKDYLLRK